MEERFYSIILMFTIHNDEKRDRFIARISDELKAKSLEDQSTYYIPKNGLWGDYCSNVKRICDELRLSESDFVNMYCSAKLRNFPDSDKEHYDKIIAVKIK